MKVNLLSIGYGNIPAFETMLNDLMYPYKIIKNIEDAEEGVLVIPGVGSIASAVPYFKESKKEFLVNYAVKNNIIGICLGFQLLTRYSEEDGGFHCLSIFDNDTKKINSNQKSHSAWERFSLTKSFINQNGFIPRFNRSKKNKISGRVFYNHEYGVSLDKSSLQIASHINFSSFAVKNNFIGVQFHPEKSQKFGLEFLRFIL